MAEFGFTLGLDLVLYNYLQFLHFLHHTGFLNPSAFHSELLA